MCVVLYISSLFVNVMQLCHCAYLVILFDEGVRTGRFGYRVFKLSILLFQFFGECEPKLLVARRVGV